MMADTNSSDKRLTSQLQETPIAIIGMASLFPESRNLHEFWENIMGKVDCIIDVPADRWEINDLYDPDPATPDKSYSKRGGFIPDIDFDPMEFGLPPNILEVTDSSQLLSLVVARDLLKDCGYVDGNFDRDHTGVILGVGGGQKLITPLVSRLQGPIWEKVLRSSGVAEDDIQTLIEKMKKAYIPWVENSFPGMLGNVIAGRVANRFDLGGTNCVVDAACAGSLAAMKMAISDLLEFKANTMITGGVDTDNSPFMYLNFSKTPAFTSDEVPKPFDEASHGIVIGEGVGMVMLKRLEDAEHDNDRIYAVIKGVGTSSDGRFKSIYAPRASGQSVAIDRAYADAGFDKSTVKLVEAHGTGTKAGDAAEFDGLKLAFDSEDHEKQHIALGSIKSQIGHTKTAAGSAGMIKTALALYHKILPPTINVDNPNPKLDIENSSFYLNTDTRPWINNAKTPRRAGVSSFGFGGSNYHFVLEEYLSDAEQVADKGYRKHDVQRALVLHGSTPEVLASKCQSWLEALQKDASGLEYYNFVTEAENCKVPAADARLGFVAKDQTAVIELLTTALEQLSKGQWEHPTGGIHYRAQALPEDSKVVALFSGQGSQYLNMCKDLTLNFPPMRESFAKMGQLLLNDNDTALSSAVFPERAFDEAGKKAQEERLKLTQYIQPAIGSVSAGLFKMMQQSGFKADIVAGHSYGELTALWAAGVIDDDGFYSLSRARAVAMGTSPAAGYDAGAMLAVMGDAKEIEQKVEALEQISIANYNSPKQLVVAGPTEAIAAAAKTLKADGFSVVALPVSAAFHSSLVAFADKPFSDAIEKQTFKKPHTAIFSNVTAKPYPKSAKEIKQSFKSNMLNSVRFTQEINAIADQGGTIFVEFGPKSVLTRLVNAILGDRPHVAVAMNSSPKGDSDTRYRDALVQLKVAGVELNLKDIYQRDLELPVSKKAGMKIKLNGGNYVSDATKQAFEDALNDGFQLALPQQPDALQQTEPVQATQPAPTTAADQGLNQSEWLQAQTATMSAHETYLLNQQDYSQGFFNMMHHLVDEFGAKNQAVPENISQSIADLHQHQQDTLRVHQSYLQGQIEFNRASSQFISGTPTGSYQPTAVAAPTAKQAVVQQQTVTPPAPAAAPVTPVAVEAPTLALDAKQIQKGMLEIVQDKTGYPIEMLDLNMNMEADLGIDSIKRVEILGAMTSKFPELPELDQNALAEMQTLLEIVEYVEQKAGAAAPTAAAPAVAAPSGLDSATIQQGMLEIVHEKTGYPVEMLDLNMNMEADLGIDSIKRVEILGAMTCKFPELPELDQNALAEMQTLLEIVEYVEQKGGATAPAATSGLDSATIQQGMLEIVHEKTGYPVEMLDLNMNMEADLGIDSIKRVEILGAMTSKFPELPELDQNALAEMQTLLEIVQYVEIKSSAGDASETEIISASSVLDEAAIQQSMLEIVHEKTGYPVEMLDLNMNLEADLGIDSIKRVEILGAMTSKFPELPEMDQNALSEMGTLAEIVAYVKSLVPQDSSISRALSEQAEVVGTAVNDVAFTTTESMVVKKYLPRPDALESEISVTGRSCLITDSGENLTYNTAKALKDLGWSVTVLQFPASLIAKPSRLPRGVQTVKLAEATDAELAKVLSAVTEAQTLNGFIHLSARPVDTSSKISFSEPEQTLLKMVFFSAKYLQQALTTKPAQGRNFFVTISYMDGEIGTAGRNAFDLSQGGLNGLVKSLNLEWDEVFCRAIDLDPDLDDKNSAQIVIDELFDPDLSITEVGNSAKGRMTLAGEVRANALLETPNDKINDSSVFFVSGGAKGVTAACVMQLAEQYHCRFILAGRAAYNGSEPAWANGISDDSELKRKIMEVLKEEGEKPTPVIVNQRLRAIKSDREISSTLSQIAALGGKAEYISANITDGAALKASVAPAVATLGKITGLIHGAGVLADKPIEKKTETDFASVLNTKIAGLAAMLSLVRMEELEYLVLFSSAAGFYGNNGQSDYSVANEILNKTAYQVSQFYPSCHVISFNWGPWDGGMVTPELKRYFQQRNVEIIPIVEGAEIFSNELHQERSATIQLLVGSSMRSDVDNSNTPLRTFQINTRLLLEDNPFLGDHVIGGNPVLPSATALSWMANICERLSPSYSFVECDNFQVLKGIVFDTAQADFYQVDVKGLANDENISRFQVTISSKNNRDKQVWHYKADIQVAKELPAVPMYTQSDLNETESTTGEALYENGTLFHGSLFQGIEKVINTSMKKLTLLCNLDKIKDDVQGQFPISSINPFATDLMFQAMLVWVREHRHLGSLPLKFLKVVNYKLIPEDKEFYVSLDVDSTSETNMTADVTIHDKMGHIYSKAFGAEVTVSPSLNSMFTTK
ncbi:omega-3 polyunsaturated fatty acid synthase subunit, PfaA [hydrothermal vent metagenome]|uniref:Omega-3 polyunsaturated fatty acid synthase subunit, PfaA n=1 Tax=hydrothermal vent metagenome TaxID=652676 RepID=A0A3B1BEX0_9ZZZZ